MTQVTNMAARIGTLEGRLAEEASGRKQAERSLVACGQRLREIERELVAARIDRMTGKEALLGICATLHRPLEHTPPPQANAWHLAHDALERMNHAGETA